MPFLGDFLADKTAERQAVRNGIAAQSIGTVNAARHFAGSIKIRNDLTAAVNDFSRRVNHHTAHRMMHAHANISSPERRLFDREEIALVLAELVFAGLDPALNSSTVAFSAAGGSPIF